MKGFLIFAQSILDTNMASLQMNDYKVTFSQFYPIYLEEVKIYEKIGQEKICNILKVCI